MKRTPHRIIGANDALKSHEKNSASPVHVNARAQSPEVKSSPSPHSGKKSPSPSPQGKPSPQHVKRKHYRNKGNSPPSRHAKSPPHSPTEHPSPIRFKKAVVPFPLALDVHASPLPEPLLTPHMTPATLVSESRLDGSPNRRTIGRLHVACALTVLVACVVVGVLVHIMIIRSVSSSERQACKLEVCQTYATYVDQSVNASVDPCKSFYHYVCDGWNSKNTLSVRRKQLDSYISLVHHSVNVHQKAVPTSGQSGDQKAIAFYRSCTDVQKRTENELPEIKRILTKANLTWPHNSSNVNLLGAVFYVTRVLDLSVLINVEARMNATDATVSFSKPDYLQDVIKRRDDLIRRKEYKIFVTRLMEHFATAGEPVIAYEDQLQLEETPFRLLRDVAEEDDDGGPPTMYEMEIMTSIAGYTQDRWKRALEEHLGIPGNLKIHIEFRSARFTAVIFSIMSHLEESLLQFLAGYLLAIQGACRPRKFKILLRRYHEVHGQRLPIPPRAPVANIGGTARPL
ncbi:uncharacterized protein LOC135367892 isoform X2 [Ornithodoros turicata]|uniref:uncharacterized protein LOC135367892 isoform X2 n=1 Tax=Ornithodoros turicata TaxID=34597 RepID=UPI00313A2FD1